MGLKWSRGGGLIGYGDQTFSGRACHLDKNIGLMYIKNNMFTLFLSLCTF